MASLRKSLGLKTVQTGLSIACAVFCLCVGQSHAAVLLRGDLNQNGRVDLPDAVAALRLSVKGLPSLEELASGDVAPVPGVGGRTVGDGRITILDAIRILRYVLQLDPSADFYGGETPDLDASATTLRLNAFQARTRLFASPPGAEIPVSIVIAGADRIGMGAVTLSVSPENGAPPLAFLRAEAGGLLHGVPALLVTPTSLSDGTLTVRAAFSLEGRDSVSGSGEVLRFIFQNVGAVPPAASYRWTLADGDLSTETADGIAPSDARLILSIRGLEEAP